MAATPNPAPPAVGVQFHGTWDMYWDGPTPNAMFAAHLDALAAHHVQVLRTDVGWSTAQPTNAPPDPGQWYHQRLTAVVDAVRARGMQIFLTVHQSPGWARPGTGGEVKQFPTDPDTMKPWLTWLAKTYGQRLLGVEVWNEPNLAEFTGVPDAAERARRYVPVLKAAYEALKAGDPALPVIFGGPSQTDDVFIRGCYQAGAHGFFDVMAVHPYQGNQTKAPEATDITGKARMTNLPAVIALMAANGDGGKPIWWTEFGISVHSNVGIPTGQPWLFGVASNEVSASFDLRASFLAWREYPQVKVAVVYCAYKPDTDAHQFGFRLLDADGTPHPQLAALKSLRLGFGGLQVPS